MRVEVPTNVIASEVKQVSPTPVLVRDPSEVLVRRIELGGTQNQHLHPPSGPVSDPWRDQDRGAGGNLVADAIQFQGGIRLALQNHVNLCMLAMEMVSSVLGYIGQMHRARKLVLVGKGPPGNPAGAGHRR